MISDGPKGFIPAITVSGEVETTIVRRALIDYGLKIVETIPEMIAQEDPDSTDAMFERLGIVVTLIGDLD